MAGFPISVTALKKHNLRMLQILLVTLGNDEEAFDFGIDDPGKDDTFEFPFSCYSCYEILFDCFTQPQLKMRGIAIERDSSSKNFS